MRQITFVANTANFAAPVQRSAGEVRALSAALKDAQKASRESFREMELQAKAAGASDAELRKVQQQRFREELAFSQTKKQLDAENVKGSASAVSAEEAKKRAIDLTTKALQQQRAEVARQLPVQDNSGHYTPTRVQRNGALIRGGGVRAAELSASFIPGFDTIASAAFPVLGLGTLALEGVRGFTEMRDAIREVQETSMRLREGFEGLNAPIELSTDSLKKQNAELAFAIAKIEHKPVNGLALAAADAALEMDHLADRANNAYSAVKKLLQENRIGAVKAYFSGQGNTGEVSDLVEGGFRDIAHLTADQRRAVRAGGEDSPAARAAGAALAARQARLRSDIAAFQAKINGSEVVDETGAFGVKTKRSVSYAQAHGDQSANRDIAQGALDSLDDQAADDVERKQNAVLTQKQKQLELQKANSTASLAAQKKAEEDQRQQWANDLAALESSGAATLSQVHGFWVDRENSVKVGSANYLVAEKNANESLKKLNTEDRKTAEERLKRQAELEKQQRAQIVGQGKDLGGDAYAKGQLAAAKSGMALRDQQDDATRAIAEQNIQWQVQFGHMSKADAALQLQKLHTEQYVVSLQRLRAAYDAVAAGPDADAQRNGISSQIVSLQTQRAMQQMQDQAAIMQTTMLYSLQQTGRGVLDGINGDIANASTEWGRRGQYHVGRQLMNNIGGSLRIAGGSLTKMGLEKVEGIFGFGKPDGSRNNPLNVNVVNGFGGAFGLGGAAHSDGLASLFPSGDWSSPKSVMGGGVGDALKSTVGFFGSMFGGARAGGGPVMPGRAYLAGENGPELFMPSTTGYVATADRTAQMGARGGVSIGYMDLSGTSDPAQSRVQARRGAAEGYAASSRYQASAQKEQQRRRPLSAR